ncbi:MAG: DUF47 family protein [Burkholderiales bacterium]|nr:DUF47 family protein [Burkholderiales bacterium]
MALNLFGALMPPDERFTTLFGEQARCILDAATLLRTMMAGGSGPEPHVKAMRAIEVAADAIARKVFLAANRTFNAPLDREDILVLGRELDDAVDLIEDAVKGIARYDVHAFPAEVMGMADGIVTAAQRLCEVMPHLDAPTRNHREIFRLCAEVGTIEGDADDAFDRALTALRAQLRAGEIDTIAYLDRKELYELVESVVDKCDDIANAVQTITTKHV